MTPAHRTARGLLVGLAIVGLGWPLAPAAAQPSRPFTRVVADFIAKHIPRFASPRVGARTILAHLEAGRGGAIAERGWVEEVRLLRHVPAVPLARPAALAARAGAEFRPRVVNLVPKGAAGFSETFGRRATSRELSSVAAEVTRFEAEGAVSVAGPAQLQALVDDLAAAGATDIIVVGHSVPAANGGRTLVLPDGGQVPEATLMAWAERLGLGCRVVTCYSQSIGLDSPIPLSTARQLIQNANGAGGTIQLWDEAFVRGRESSAASYVGVLGSSPAAGGGYMRWESLRPRPPWIAALGWVMLAVTAATNALVMWYARRQSERPVGSAGEAGDYIRETFDRWRRGRRATLVLVVLAAAAVGESAWLALRHAEFDASQGRAWGDGPWWTIGVAIAAVVFAVLAAVSCRVDPSTSRLGRGAHRLSAGLTGALLGGALGFLFLAAIIAIFVAWGALLRIVPNWLNGSGNTGAWAAGVAGEMVGYCEVVAAFTALYGASELAPAGARGEPVYLRARVFLRWQRPTEAPAEAKPLSRWGFVGQTAFVWLLFVALGWLLVAWLAWGVVGTVLFGAGIIRTQPALDDASWKWAVVASSAILIAFHGRVAYDLCRGRVAFRPTGPNQLSPVFSRYFSGRVAVALAVLAFSSLYTLRCLRTVPRFSVEQPVVLAASATDYPVAVVHVEKVPVGQVEPLDRLWKVAGPTGIVFANPAESELLTSGVVVAGARAAVVKDDDDDDDRHVLVRLVRDARFGADPGVLVWVRAAALHPAPP